MRTLQRSLPRRYHVDNTGQRVLVGLTTRETYEFEQLDGRHSLNAGLGSKAIVSREDERWFELYTKHDDAWKSWMAESNTKRLERSKPTLGGPRTHKMQEQVKLPKN